jgi:hypothetical protein
VLSNRVKQVSMSIKRRNLYIDFIRKFNKGLIMASVVLIYHANEMTEWKFAKCGNYAVLDIQSVN